MADLSNYLLTEEGWVLMSKILPMTGEGLITAMLIFVGVGIACLLAWRDIESEKKFNQDYPPFVWHQQVVVVGKGFYNGATGVVTKRTGLGGSVYKVKLSEGETVNFHRRELSKSE